MVFLSPQILSIPLRDPRNETSAERGGPGDGDPNRKPWLVVHAAEMDANQDGFLERSELQQACREVFAMYDRNGEGTPAVEEYAGGRGMARHTMGGFVKQHSREIDANADGRITLDELLSLAENASRANKEKYQNLPPGRMHRDPLRAAITEDLDAGVGLLLKEVDKLGIADSTYVIYMSDNGGGGGGRGRGKGGARPLQGGKGSLWEGGIRVPFIVRGPGIKPNTFCHVSVVGYDLLPTFCDLAKVAARLPEGLEGGSIVDLLHNGDAGQVQRPRKEIVFHFPHYQSGDGPHSAIRLGNEKLIRFDETGEIRLFDLSQDIGERHDLSAARPQRTKELLQRMDAYLEAIDAQHAVRNPNYDPNREPTAKPGRKGRKAGKKRERRIRQPR